MPSEKLIDLLLAYIGERADKITEIGPLTDAEWEALLRLATIQGVAPLLYHRLNNAGTQVPEAVLDGFCKLYHQNAFKNAQYYQELPEVLKQLQRGGIDVIVLKGAFLAKTVYQTEALRVIGDIDLLVKAADLGQAEKRLLEMGYGPTKRPNIQAQCAVCHHLVPFTKTDAFSVEIHWTLYLAQNCPFDIMVDMLWEQAKPFTVADVQVFSLSPENLLLHLCIHAYANSFIGMRFFCDIHNTIRYYQIDWDDLFQRACQWKAEKVVYLALYLAKDLLAANVPDNVLESFKPDDFDLEVVASAKAIIRVDTKHWLIEKYHFATLWKPNKSFWQKLLLLLQRIFPPLDTLACWYHIPENSLRVYFYYPVRLKDLLIKYSGIVWRILRHDKEMQTVMTQENRIARLKDWIKSK